MTLNLEIPATVSFGANITKPGLLETRTTGDLLCSIQSGAWRETVERVRSLPADSTAQKTAKRALPFATWAGVFTYRSNDALVRHSGQCGVDLDDLGDSGVTEVMQTAVADRHCLAAFRSARGEGVRLLFRVPPCSAREHPAVFEQVADYVRNTYRHEADKSGSDVSRASFVSFDAGLWFFGLAEILPIQLSDLVHNGLKKKLVVYHPPAVYAGQLAYTWPTWFGRNHAKSAQRTDATVKTHWELLELGKAIALHADRIRQPLTDRMIHEASDAWLKQHAKQGDRLRCPADEYRAELAESVRGAQRKPWFRFAANKWLRWTQHKDFPQTGTPVERLLFVIHRHCNDAGSNEFYLGVRDAGLIVGGHFNTGARLLRKLVADGILLKPNIRRKKRHAQTYRLQTHDEHNGNV